MNKQLPVLNFLAKFTVVLCLVSSPYLALSQDARSIDGVGNNVSNPMLGSAGDLQARLTPAAYLDGVGEPFLNSNSTRPNPREVSNKLFAQNQVVADPLSLSDFTWVFGQFIDHDITLVENGSEPMLNIVAPEGDDFFEEGSIIPMLRSSVAPGTGTDSPREYTNQVTTFLDGSAIYGSEEKVASWLRSHKDGKLKVSAQNLLPWNTQDNKFNSVVDYAAPVMSDDTGILSKYFVAGDVRANENPLLLAMHTLFVREHNRFCEVLKERHPGWNDERLYQGARKYVIAVLQNIVYNEWLPAIGIEVAPYTGYKPQTVPRIFNEFSAAGFRFGHTLINSNIIRMSDNGAVVNAGNISLRDAFFNPSVINFAGGIEPYLKGMGTQIQQDFDCKIIDDVRNFLFEEGEEGGLDLAAININRGRDRGLPDFNTLRTSLGFPRYTSMQDLTNSVDDSSVLQEVYGDVNNIDAWVGMLAEEREEGKLFGKVVAYLMERQFQILRDGDRFYFENEQFEENDFEAILATTMRDVIMNNTDISLMQDEVFRAMPHSNIEQGPDLIPFFLDAAVYPNPATDQVSIKFYGDSDDEISLRLIDNIGRTILIQPVHVYNGANYVTIPLANCPRGLYNVVLENDRRYKVLKVIKE